MQRILLAMMAIPLLAGCASHPERIRSASISEVAEMARSERAEDRRVDHIPSYSTNDGSASGHGTSSASSITFSGEASDTSSPLDGGLDDAEVRIWLGRRLPEQGRASRYSTGWGYELGVGAFIENIDINASLFYSGVEFDQPNADRLNDPGLVGWEINVGGRWPIYQHLSFQAGAGVGSGWLFWRYANPLLDGPDEITDDTLGYFGFQTPVSLQSHFGPVMTEFAALPTVRFGYQYSQEGFGNDITRLYWGVPFAIRLGVVF